MKPDVLDSVVSDLLSITPLIRRNIQRKLVRTAFAGIEEHITLPHLEIMLTLMTSTLPSGGAAGISPPSIAGCRKNWASRSIRTKSACN